MAVLIDDIPNLNTIQRWTQGRLNWWSAIDNRSGPLGRYVSMLSFLADAARSGAMEPGQAFKTTGLVIHILCGALIYVLSSRYFAGSTRCGNIASTAALFRRRMVALPPAACQYGALHRATHGAARSVVHLACADDLW